MRPGAATRRRLRVAVLLSGLPSTGGETVVVQSLPYLRDAGVEPVLITLTTRRDGPLTKQISAAGIRRIDVGAHRMTDPGATWRLVAAIRRERIDVIHAHDQDTIILGGLARTLLRTSLVISRHVLIEPADSVREHVRARLVLAVARRLADRVIIVADAVMAPLTAMGRVPVDRITTVHNGLVLDNFDAAANRAATRRALGWDDDTPIVLMIAWFRPGKGHEQLEPIMSGVRARIPRARLVLVGDGTLAGEVRAQLAPLGDAVEFLGTRDDVPALLRAADVLVLPSWSEALPTTLLEAAAAALPAVATDVGGTREVVRDGVTGSLVPPGRPDLFAARLVALLEHRAMAQEMGRRARTRVEEEFSGTGRPSARSPCTVTCSL